MEILTQTKTISPVQKVSLSLKPTIQQKKQKQKPKRRMKPKRILTWKGQEKLKKEVRKAAEQYSKTNAKLEELCDRNKWSSLGCTVKEQKGHSTNIPQAKKAAEALSQLMALNRLCIEKHNLHPDLVRAVWAPILNPQASEIERCRQLCFKATK